MSETQTELLIILESDRAASARAEIEAIAPVIQALQPRILLVRADPKARERIARVSRVRGVYANAPAELPPDLSPSEATFVAAWAARQKPKRRTGEGLNWGAPGFEAPDAPHEKSPAAMLNNLSDRRD